MILRRLHSGFQPILHSSFFILNSQFFLPRVLQVIITFCLPQLLLPHHHFIHDNNKDFSQGKLETVG